VGKTLYRYIILELFKLLFPIWLSLAFMLFLLEFLAQVFNVPGSFGDVLWLYLTKIPAHLQVIFPAAVLFSVMVFLGAMTKSRELVAAQAVGYSRNDVMKAVLLAIGLASIPYYFVVDQLAPNGNREHWEVHDTKIRKKPSRFSKIRQEKIWYRNQDILYNVGFFDPFKKLLFDVTLYTFDDDFHIAQTLYAKNAVWQGDSWLLLDGKVTVTDKQLARPFTQRFDARVTRLIEEPSSLQTTDVEPSTLTQSQLSDVIRRYKSLGINTAKWETIYHSRYSFFLISFVFVLLAFPRATRFRRASTPAKDGVFVGVVCFVYWLIFTFASDMGSEGKIYPIVGAWLPSVVFLVGVLVHNRRISLKAESE
jgi:lipopolysaccharide export system permease protein